MSLSDVLVGAFTHGVNASTLLVLNGIVAMAFGSLLLLLLASMHGNTALVPHVFVMLALALGLWISINWFILSIGLVDPKQQERELMGKGGSQEGEEAEGDQPQQSGGAGAETVAGAAVESSVKDLPEKKEQ